MNTDISKMVKALEAEGWSIGTDGRIARSTERGSATVEQVNASSPLARVTLDGKTRWVSVRDLVAYKHLGEVPANATLASIDGNAANTAVVGHCPSGAGWESTPTTTSSSRPFRTAQITSSCFVLISSLSCTR